MIHSFQQAYLLPSALVSYLSLLKQPSLLWPAPIRRELFLLIACIGDKKHPTLFTVKTFCHNESLCFHVKDPLLLPWKLSESFPACTRFTRHVKHHIPFVLLSVPKGCIVTEEKKTLLLSQTFLHSLIDLQKALMLFLGSIDSFTE